MPQNIGDNRIIRDGIARITLEDAERLERYRVRTGDIVYSRRGDVEKRALVRKEEDGWLCGTGCLRVRFGIDDVDSAYASFYLGDPRVRAWIVRHAQGATMPNLNTAILSALPFVVPPVEEQRAIAQILSALDDRIEMLRNMNETLEAIAQATFKSWFVDFDPVRAKAEGREPEGMNAAVAALFSSRFQDSELGSIPQGWTTGPITNVLSLNPVRSLKKEVPATYLDMASVPTSGYRASSWIKRDFGSGSKFINGDTLLARITPCLENGKTAYVDFLKQGEVGWGSTEFIVMATKPNVPSQFAYLLARDLEFRQYAIQSMSGTSGRQRVQVDQLANFKFSYATEAVYRAFGEIVEPLFTAMSHNDNHAKSLMDLRDTLLPRLISGKMRMPKPEQLLEAVL
jgi:type I restriction enzyme S subunit